MADLWRILKYDVMNKISVRKLYVIPTNHFRVKSQGTRIYTSQIRNISGPQRKMLVQYEILQNLTRVHEYKICRGHAGKRLVEGDQAFLVPHAWTLWELFVEQKEDLSRKFRSTLSISWWGI